jgi:hypothetical protein
MAASRFNRRTMGGRKESFWSNGTKVLLVHTTMTHCPCERFAHKICLTIKTSIEIALFLQYPKYNIMVNQDCDFRGWLAASLLNHGIFDNVVSLCVD